MPFVNITLVEGSFTAEQKHEMAAAISELAGKFEGSEAVHEVVWVHFEETPKDGWPIGGAMPFAGPASWLEKTRENFAAASPVHPD